MTKIKQFYLDKSQNVSKTRTLGFPVFFRSEFLGIRGQLSKFVEKFIRDLEISRI